MYPTAEEVAAVLAAMLMRSGQTRARVSALTIKKIARRRTLRCAFTAPLSDALEAGYDWRLIELSSGGFGAIQAKALEAAKSVTGNKYLSAEERRALVRGTVKYSDYHQEAVGDEEDDDVD